MYKGGAKDSRTNSRTTKLALHLVDSLKFLGSAVIVSDIWNVHAIKNIVLDLEGAYARTYVGLDGSSTCLMSRPSRELSSPLR